MYLHFFFYMVTWFEKSKEIILSQGNSKDEAVINMIEELFDRSPPMCFWNRTFCFVGLELHGYGFCYYRIQRPKRLTKWKEILYMMNLFFYMMHLKTQLQIWKVLKTFSKNVVYWMKYDSGRKHIIVRQIFNNNNNNRWH